MHKKYKNQLENSKFLASLTLFFLFLYVSIIQINFSPLELVYESLWTFIFLVWGLALLFAYGIMHSRENFLVPFIFSVLVIVVNIIFVYPTINELVDVELARDKHLKELKTEMVSYLKTEETKTITKFTFLDDFTIRDLSKPLYIDVLIDGKKQEGTKVLFVDDKSLKKNTLYNVKDVFKDSELDVDYVYNTTNKGKTVEN